VDDTRHLDLTPLQPPYQLGKDGKNRWVFAFNVASWKEPTTRVVPVNRLRSEPLTLLEPLQHPVPPRQHRQR